MGNPHNGAEMKLSSWIQSNTPETRMLWAEWAQGQFEQFENLALSLGTTANVVGHHSSKLPVVELCFPGGRVIIRDNFDDWNVAFQFLHPVNLPLGKVLQPMSWDWYLTEIARCGEYSWSHWSEEEIQDPRILRVQRTRKDGSTYWPSPVTPEEKDRWIARMTDPSWWSTDWSSGELFVEGGMGPDFSLYLADRCFLQGMDNLLPREEDRKTYRPGAKRFVASLNGPERVLEILTEILESQKTALGISC